MTPTNSHDRDSTFICRRCGQGLTARDVLDGEKPCPAPPADDVRECPSSDTTYEQGLFACRNCGENAAMHEFRPRGTVTEAEAEREAILADLREWSRPLGDSAEEEVLKLVIAHIEARNA